MTRSPVTAIHHPGSGRSPFRRATMGVALSVIVLLAVVAPADATWSVIAVDPETGEVGVATAACSPVSALAEPGEVVYPAVLAPGRGVGVIQGAVDPALIPLLEGLMNDTNASGDDVIEQLTNADDPELVDTRQLVVITKDGLTAAIGEATQPESASEPVFGADRSTRIAVQGVNLVDERVVTDGVDAASQASGLADALVAGLVAGSEAGGDRDCGEQTALFAQLAVAAPGEDGRRPARVLTVTVDEGDGQNPVLLLAAAHERGEQGWIDAGRRPPSTVPRLLVFLVGLALAGVATAVIAYGMGYRRPRRRI